MSLSYYIKMVLILVPIASQLILNFFVKSGKTKIGAKHNFSFNNLKTFYCSLSQLKSKDFTILVSGVTIVLRSLRKHL